MNLTILNQVVFKWHCATESDPNSANQNILNANDNLVLIGAMACVTSNHLLTTCKYLNKTLNSLTLIMKCSVVCNIYTLASAEEDKVD